MSEDKEGIARDFNFHYHNAQLEEEPNDVFKTAASKRKCMLLAYLKSNLHNSNQATCFLLEEKLKSYGKLIDDRKGINNFAEATMNHLSDVRNVSNTFQSGLPDVIPNVIDLLQNIPGHCENREEGKGCSSTEPSLKDVQSMFKHLDLVNSNDVPMLSQTSSQSFAESNSSLGFKKTQKTSLYSDYVDPEKDTYRKVNRFGQKAPNSKPWEDEGGRLGSHKRSFLQEESLQSPKKFARNRATGMFGQQSRNTNKFVNEDPQVRNDINVPEGIGFRTAGEQLKQEQLKKFGNSNNSHQAGGMIKKSLGGKPKVSNKFVPPKRNPEDGGGQMRRDFDQEQSGDEEIDERLKHIEPKMIELIRSEIMDTGANVSWDDIAGLEYAKSTIQEIVVWPMLRPDIFTGLRRPPKGILLFGPPGTGKTLIGKCIASQSKSTFFSISASSLTSKWIGDGEKMVRALFAVARVHQPAVVFIDEIDSLLSQRSETEHESSRRIKTEFLVQLDGAATGEEDRILIIGATNRPQELDEAARRRLVKRLYIPLPETEARKQIVTNLLRSEKNDLTEADIDEIALLSDGYSGADVKNLCQEASLGPIRSISATQMFHISPDQVRPLNVDDFKSALKRVRSSVSPKDLETYLAWDQLYGSGGSS